MDTAQSQFGPILSEDPAPKRQFPRGKLPRNLQDRSKYLPHQGLKECQRRRRQILSGQLRVPPELRLCSEAGG